MRPFWITVRTDGRKNDVGTGPRANNGSMAASIAAKVEGSSVQMVWVSCYSDEGKLRICTELKNACKYGSLAYTWRAEENQNNLANKTDIEVLREMLKKPRERAGENDEAYIDLITDLLLEAKKAGLDGNVIVSAALRHVAVEGGE